MILRRFVRDRSVFIEVIGPGDGFGLFTGKVVASESPYHKVGTLDDCWCESDFTVFNAGDDFYLDRYVDKELHLFKVRRHVLAKLKIDPTQTLTEDTVRKLLNFMRRR